MFCLRTKTANKTRTSRVSTLMETTKSALPQSMTKDSRPCTIISKNKWALLKLQHNWEDFTKYIWTMWREKRGLKNRFNKWLLSRWQPFESPMIRNHMPYNSSMIRRRNQRNTKYPSKIMRRGNKIYKDLRESISN